MTKIEVQGHDRVWEFFRSAATRGRLPGTYLFVGPSGIGKRTFAEKLAQALLCTTGNPNHLEACGRCPSCVQVVAGTHPDLDRIGLPEGKSELPIRLFIGEDEKRMREGMCYNLSAKPFYGRRKVAIVDDVDALNTEGANAILKTLEEPPPGAVLILIGTSEQRQLPTIRSRCRIVRFSPLTQNEVENILLQNGFVESPEQATVGAVLGSGSVEEVLTWLDPTLSEFREQLLLRLAVGRIDQLEVSTFVQGFAAPKTKENVEKRRNLHLALDVAEMFYRELLRFLAGHAATQTDRTLERAVSDAARHWPQDVDAVVLCLERTIQAHSHIDANASPANIIDAWLDDLANILREGIPASR